ncbi:MAG: DUF1501 domain-containing protein [Gemmatimonadaceae bacterium]
MHVRPPEQCGCNEYQELSRRGFLTGAGMGVAALGLPRWMPSMVFAESANTSRDIVVSVFMRGGADGLTLVAPFGDQDYYTGRPNIAVPRPDSSSPSRGLALDNFFMLPPAMAGLLPPYLANQLLIVHAAGQSTNNTRSHFEAERYIEAGKPADYSISTGWLARHLLTSRPVNASAPLRGISIGWGGLRLTLTGAPRTLPIPQPENYRHYAPNDTVMDRMFNSGWSPARNAAKDALATVRLLQQIDFASYVPANGAIYPTSDFGHGFRSLAALIKSDSGLEAAHLDIGGWDTHANQGSTSGYMHTLMQDFANTLGAFWKDVMQGPTSRRITLVCLSEFGRNARENGSLGTDHGRASVAFVMGPNIAGGRVLSQWPGLNPAVLEDGQDLRVTIDHRDILAEVVQQRLGNPNISTIFPGYVPVPRGITT